MGFFDTLLDIGSFIPGPQQPFVAGANTVRHATSGGGDGGGDQGFLSGLGELARKYGGPIAGLLSMGQGRRLSAGALNAQREGLDFARQREESTQPFRDVALRDITGGLPMAPELGGVFNDPTNPFSRSSPSLSKLLPVLGPQALPQNQGAVAPIDLPIEPDREYDPRFNGIMGAR